MSKNFTKISSIIATSVLLIVGLSACSSNNNVSTEETTKNGTPIPTLDPKGADLPPAKNTDPSLKTPKALVEAKTVTIKIGESVKLDIPLEDYTSWNGLSSDPNVASYVAGHVIAEGDPMPSTAPAVNGLAVGKSTITLTDKDGKTYVFDLDVVS